MCAAVKNQKQFIKNNNLSRNWQVTNEVIKGIEKQIIYLFNIKL